MIKAQDAASDIAGGTDDADSGPENMVESLPEIPSNIPPGTRVCAIVNPLSGKKAGFTTNAQGVAEVTAALESQDINFLMDMYLEMVDRTSPAIDGLDAEELEALKKALREINWNELSGKQWYAGKRFLLSIFPDLLSGRLHGFSSTSNSTTNNEESDSAPTV